MDITAHVKELPPNADGKVYNTIDISTIQCDGVADTQQEIPEEIPAVIVAEIKALAKGCKKQSELTSKINKAKKFALLTFAMQLVE